MRCMHDSHHYQQMVLGQAQLPPLTSPTATHPTVATDKGEKATMGELTATSARHYPSSGGALDVTLVPRRSLVQEDDGWVPRLMALAPLKEKVAQEVAVARQTPICMANQRPEEPPAVDLPPSPHPAPAVPLPEMKRPVHEPHRDEIDYSLPEDSAGDPPAGTHQAKLLGLLRDPKKREAALVSLIPKPKGPKAAPNGYRLYLLEKREAVRARLPAEATGKEVLAALTAGWKALEPDARKEYQSRAKVLAETWAERSKADAESAGAEARAKAEQTLRLYEMQLRLGMVCATATTLCPARPSCRAHP